MWNSFSSEMLSCQVDMTNYMSIVWLRKMKVFPPWPYNALHQKNARFYFTLQTVYSALIHTHSKFWDGSLIIFVQIPLIYKLQLYTFLTIAFVCRLWFYILMGVIVLVDITCKLVLCLACMNHFAEMMPHTKNEWLVRDQWFAIYRVYPVRKRILWTADRF